MKKQNYVIINRDSFARADFVRRIHYTNKPCNWCGGKRKRGNNFQYGWYQDGLSKMIDWQDKVFCCVSCYNQYWDLGSG